MVRHADALAWMAERVFEPGDAPALSPDRHETVVHVEAEVLVSGGAGRCEIEHRTAIAAETARRLCGCGDGRCPIQTTTHNSSMDHLESVKPFPRNYTVNAPIAVGIGVSRLQARTSAAWRDRDLRRAAGSPGRPHRDRPGMRADRPLPRAVVTNPRGSGAWSCRGVRLIDQVLRSRAFPGGTAQDIVSATDRHARAGIRADGMEA